LGNKTRALLSWEQIVEGEERKEKNRRKSIKKETCVKT
jgi:hypothetical protein